MLASYSSTIVVNQLIGNSHTSVLPARREPTYILVGRY